jgi:aspartyl-tRNA(Asn)/glutamyl-tRNA(Gln) amidotransferase subunit B
MGHPGTLPKTNKKAVEYAIKMGIACESTIEENNYFARKNYFYPDLPKGYQISQHTTPICVGGKVAIQLNGQSSYVQLNRIHLEEDAGKSIHDISPTDTCIDLNRAGTALIEIVTEPCIHSAEEAFQYVTEVRKLVRWLGICDGNMEEGSLRCDANISVRPMGTSILGTKVEVKNLNSIRNIKKAIEFEIERLTALVEAGETIIQQTRSFDANNDTTFAIRDKEDANDYRYFPDPDLAPFQLTKGYIDTIKASIPALPNQLKKEWKNTLGLSDYDIEQITENKEEAAFFTNWIQTTTNYKSVVNWILGPIREYLNETGLTYTQLNTSFIQLNEILNLVESNQLSFANATGKVFKGIVGTNMSALQFAQEQQLIQNNSTDAINQWVEQVLNAHPEKVAAYKNGKKGLMGVFIGEVKKISKGQADPKKTTQILEKKLV